MATAAILSAGVLLSTAASCSLLNQPISQFSEVLDLGGDGRDLATPKGTQDMALVGQQAQDMALVGQQAQDMASEPSADLAAFTDLATSASADLAGPPSCVPQTMPCDLVCQDCGGGGKCSFNGNHMPACFAAGPVPTGGDCYRQGTDDCVPGDVCVQMSKANAVYKCFAFCRNDGDCHGDGKCLNQFVGVNNILFCTEPVTNCDPVQQAGCQNGACFPVTPTGDTGCHQAGPGGQGSACLTDYDCQATFMCVSSKCNKVCRPANGNAGCPMGTQCYPINGWPVYGACDV